MSKQKDKLLNEHLKRIIKKTNYVLESPSYKAIIDDDFDSYDDPTEYMGGVNPVDGTSPLREEDPVPDEEKEGGGEIGDIEAQALGMDKPTDNQGEQPQGTENEEIPSPVDDESEEEIPPDQPAQGLEPERNPDQIQNDIIKSNIEVMRQLNQKIEGLESGISQLNMQNQQLVSKTQEMEREVEEVREPTNVEKLMTKKEDSHPYYYGLNDMWKGNWFQARRDQMGEQGIKQLDDGSYVADFDQLPQYGNNEIKDSFDTY